jgi:hypothetical protein
MRFLGAAVLFALGSQVAAADLQWQGETGVRWLADPAGETAWPDGGLGKTRSGAASDALVFDGALALHWQLSPAWSASADLQARSDVTPALGVIDASLRYRPASTTPWRWSLRLGAFFPPVSMENDAVGWTSPWTLTSSAANTWVGEELRTIGAEWRLEHRGARGTLEFGIAAFVANDPAGELLADRGWALHDLVTPLGASLREPDVLGPVVRATPPLRFQPFVENDGRVGFHADLDWQAAGGTRIRVMRYDNRADPASSSLQEDRRVFSWHTRFWSAGAEWPIGGLSLLAQWLDGNTAFEPVPELYLDSRFRTAYLLAGRNRGTWRPTVRWERFDVRRVRDSPDGPAALVAPDPMSEHGSAWTVALNWRPTSALRITGEWLQVRSDRLQRQLAGLPATRRDQQFQLSLRLIF